MLFRNMMSVSKLKSVSNMLGCSFSSLKNSLRSTSIRDCKVLHMNVVRAIATQQSVSVDELYKEVDMQTITEGNEDLLKKLKVLMLEVEVLRQEGQRVPSVLSDDKWKELLTKPSRSQRIKQLAFWALNERRKLATIKKKEEAKLLRGTNIEEFEKRKETDHIYYGFGGSTIFTRIYDITIDNSMNQKLIRAMMFGQELVVDCSYDEHMTLQEASLCAKQLCYMFAENRLSNDPFNLYFCNANKQSKVLQKLVKHIPTLYDKAFPLNVTEQSYLELFPKEKLVYLTPHCKQNLKTYCHDDIYIIENSVVLHFSKPVATSSTTLSNVELSRNVLVKQIGAMVDKMNNDPLSLGKAKSLGLRMAKLPLDLHLDWGLGTKSLTLNQVQSILLELKDSGDWNQAFQHIPKRKLKKYLDEKNNKKGFNYLKKRNLVL